jgi:hypothetical protein
MGTSKVKRGEKNNAFTIANIQRLTHEARGSIQASALVGCITHANNLQKEDFKRLPEIMHWN